MGYLHIENLYKNQTILAFRRCFALEKIHGTSAHISYTSGLSELGAPAGPGQITFFSGGEKHARFVDLFDAKKLLVGFKELFGYASVVVFGEAYGGSQQGQSWRYGKELKFVAFDVKVGDLWLAVPQAASVVQSLGLEFVHFVEIPTDLDALNAERDAPSEQARRNGVEGVQPREGVVLRPPFEVRVNNGDRVISKHKRDEERETATPRTVDPGRLKVLADAEQIALEWVTAARLEHVLDKIPKPHSMPQTGTVIKAMVEDVTREGAGEIVDSPEARAAISKRAAQLFKSHVQKVVE